MACRLTFAIILLGIVSNADAEYISGNQLHEICQLNTERAEKEPACVFFIAGALDMYAVLQDTMTGFRRIFGTPENAIRHQTIDVVVNYLSDHPELRHNEAIGLILFSMAEAFPCDGVDSRLDAD